MHASRTSVASSSSFPQALNAVRSSPPITPITQLSVQDAGNQRDQRSRNLLLDLTVMSLQEPDEEPVDKEEVGGRNCKFTSKSTSTCYDTSRSIGSWIGFLLLTLYFYRCWTRCGPCVTVQLRSGQRQAWTARSRSQTVRTRLLNSSQTWTRPLKHLRLWQAQWVKAACPASIPQPLPPAMAPRTGVHLLFSFTYVFLFICCLNFFKIKILRSYLDTVYYTVLPSLQHLYWMTGPPVKKITFFNSSPQPWEHDSDSTYH